MSKSASYINMFWFNGTIQECQILDSHEDEPCWGRVEEEWEEYYDEETGDGDSHPYWLCRGHASVIDNGTYIKEPND